MKVTAEFHRTIRPGDYESASGSVTMEAEVPEGTDPDATIEDLFRKAKSHVLSQLGIEFSIDPSGVIVEEGPPPQSPSAAAAVVQQAMPGAQVIPMQQPQAPVPPTPYPPGGPVATGGTPRCDKDGSEMWDNRADNQRRRANGYSLGPDFKCKANREHVIWPDDYQAYKHLPKEPR